MNNDDMGESLPKMVLKNKYIYSGLPWKPLII